MFVDATLSLYVKRMLNAYAVSADKLKANSLLQILRIR